MTNTVILQTNEEGGNKYGDSQFSIVLPFNRNELWTMQVTSFNFRPMFNIFEKHTQYLKVRLFFEYFENFQSPPDETWEKKDWIKFLSGKVFTFNYPAFPFLSSSDYSTVATTLMDNNTWTLKWYKEIPRNEEGGTYDCIVNYYREKAWFKSDNKVFTVTENTLYYKKYPYKDYPEIKYIYGHHVASMTSSYWYYTPTKNILFVDEKNFDEYHSYFPEDVSPHDTQTADYCLDIHGEYLYMVKQGIWCEVINNQCIICEAATEINEGKFKFIEDVNAFIQKHTYHYNENETKFWYFPLKKYYVVYYDENDEPYIIVPDILNNGIDVIKKVNELLNLNVARAFPGNYESNEEEDEIEFVEEEEEEEEEEIYETSYFENMNVLKYWYTEAENRFWDKTSDEIYECTQNENRFPIAKFKVDEHEYEQNCIKVILEEIYAQKLETEILKWSCYTIENLFYYATEGEIYEVENGQITLDKHIESYIKEYPENKSHFIEESQYTFTLWNKTADANYKFWYASTKKEYEVLIEENYRFPYIMENNEKIYIMDILINENHGSYLEKENMRYYYEPQDRFYESHYDSALGGWKIYLEYEDHGGIEQKEAAIDPENETIMEGRLYTENILYEKYKLNEWSHYNLHKDKFYYKENKKWDDIWIHEGKDYIPGKKGTASVRLYTQEIFTEEDIRKNPILKTEDIINEEKWKLEQEYYSKNGMNSWSHYNIDGTKFWYKDRQWWFEVINDPSDENGPYIKDTIEEQPIHHMDWIFRQEDAKKNDAGKIDFPEIEEEEDEEEEVKEYLNKISAVGEFIITPLSGYNNLKNRLELGFEVSMDILNTEGETIKNRYYSRGYVTKIIIEDISEKLSEITGFVKNQIKEKSYIQSEFNVYQKQAKAEYLCIRGAKLFKPYFFEFITLSCNKVFNTGSIFNLNEVLPDPNKSSEYFRNQMVGYLMNTVSSNQYMTTGYGFPNTYYIKAGDFLNIKFTLKFDNDEKVELQSPMTIILNLSPVQ